MSVDHAATVRRLYELLNAGDIDGFAGLLADSFIEHEITPGLAPTKAGVKDFFRMQRAAFPDLRISAEDVFASGDRAVARVRYTGTHRGDFMGMPATIRPSTSSLSTCSASEPMAASTSTGASWT